MINCKAIEDLKQNMALLKESKKDINISDVIILMEAVEALIQDVEEIKVRLLHLTK